MYFQAILQSASIPFRKAIESTTQLIQSALSSSKPLVRGMSPYPTQQMACKRFINRRIKLLSNMMRWRKHAGDLYGIGNSIGELVERCLVPVLFKVKDVEGLGLKRQLREMIPKEVQPPFLRIS